MMYIALVQISCIYVVYLSYIGTFPAFEYLLVPLDWRSSALKTNLMLSSFPPINTPRKNHLTQSPDSGLSCILCFMQIFTSSRLNTIVNNFWRKYYFIPSDLHERIILECVAQP